jgi:hypothetical protein
MQVAGLRLPKDETIFRRWLHALDRHRAELPRSCGGPGSCLNFERFFSKGDNVVSSLNNRPGGKSLVMGGGGRDCQGPDGLTPCFPETPYRIPGAGPRASPAGSAVAGEEIAKGLRVWGAKGPTATGRASSPTVCRGTSPDPTLTIAFAAHAGTAISSQSSQTAQNEELKNAFCSKKSN